MKLHISFNEYHSITDTTEHLNILIDNDLEAFIDPYHIANNLGKLLAKKMYVRSKEFLKKLNQEFIIPNKRREGLMFLSHLGEANEFHLGYSFENRGKGIGATKAEVIFDSLSANKFAREGLTITNEAHNVLLLVKGVGQDNMSDTLANVCRDILADFTFNQCLKYNIPLSEFEIEYFDHITQKWNKKTVKLPKYKGREIILVPQFLTSVSRTYPNHFNWFVASNYLARDIMSGKIELEENGEFITELKNGAKKPVVKNINSHFKKPKNELIEFVKEYNGSLVDFQIHVKENYPSIDFNKLLRLHSKTTTTNL